MHFKGLAKDHLRAWMVEATRPSSQLLVSGAALCVVACDPRIVRHEGLTERLPNIEVIFAASSRDTTDEVVVDLTLYLNTNITTPIDHSGASHATLRTQDGAVRRGSQTAANAIRFEHVVIRLGSAVVNRCLIQDLYANAHQLGFPAQISAYVEVKTDGNVEVLVANPRVTAGLTMSGLNTTVVKGLHGLAPDTVSRLTSRAKPSSSQRGLNSWTVIATTAVPDFFAPRSGDFPLEISGTRLSATFSGLPANAGLWVSQTNIPLSPIEDADATYATLVRNPNPLGGGGEPSSVSSSDRMMLTIPTFNGCAIAVWEVIKRAPTNFNRQGFQLGFAFFTDAGFPAEFQVSVAFAPMSSVGTASKNDPLPRYACSLSAADLWIPLPSDAPLVV